MDISYACELGIFKIINLEMIKNINDVEYAS